MEVNFTMVRSIGIIVMAVAALPLLHISGLQLFSEETKGSDKLKKV